MAKERDQKAGRGGQKSGPRCSFCNKGPELAGLLIESPVFDRALPAYICGQCVDLCSAILQQQNRKTTAVDEQDTEYFLDATALADEITRALPKLTDLERRVMKLRYGLEDGCSYSLEEVGQRLQMPRERVREIETQVLVRLRS